MSKDIGPSQTHNEHTASIRNGIHGALEGQACRAHMLNAVSGKASSSKDGKMHCDQFGGAEGQANPDEEDFECVPCESGGTIEPIRHPGDPTEVEIAERNPAHCPIRSWCPARVEAQGEEVHHYRNAKQYVLNEAPAISMDYKELSEHEESNAKVTMIVCRDEWTKSIAAHVAEAKGSIECSTKLVEFLDSFCYIDVTLKSDNESAIEVLRGDVVNKRVRPTRPAGSIPMHPQTHGRAEKVVQDVIDQIRKGKIGLGRRLKSRVHIKIPMIHWLVNHAALLIDRHQLGHDGKIAYRRVHQREAPASQLEFGEQVLARFAPKRGKSKRKVPIAPRSTPGTWVGINESIAENIAIFQSGRVVRARVVLRRLEAERWNLEQVPAAQATPSNLNPSEPGQEITILKPADDDIKSGKDLPPTPARSDDVKRRGFKVTRSLLEAFGYTPACIGCQAAGDWSSKQTHSVYCRTRMAEQFRQSIEGQRTLQNAKGDLRQHRLMTSTLLRLPLFLLDRQRISQLTTARSCSAPVTWMNQNRKVMRTEILTSRRTKTYSPGSKA